MSENITLPKDVVAKLSRVTLIGVVLDVVCTWEVCVSLSDSRLAFGVQKSTGQS